MSGEREALELVREHLPDHEPWLAWPNFEFVDEQGRVNEVELLVFGPRGLILVEINSRRGTEGDGHSWIWTTPVAGAVDDISSAAERSCMAIKHSEPRNRAALSWKSNVFIGLDRF